MSDNNENKASGSKDSCALRFANFLRALFADCNRSSIFLNRPLTKNSEFPAAHPMAGAVLTTSCAAA